MKTFIGRHVGSTLRALARPGRGAVLLAAGIVLGAGGYAAASSSTHTIRGCVTKSHQLLISRRCARGQTRLSWDAAGRRGPVGPQGPPATSAWAYIGPNGGVTSGRDITAQEIGNGEYAVTVQNPACASVSGAIEVTPGAQAVLPGEVLTVSASPTGSLNVFHVQFDDVLNGATNPAGPNAFSVTVNCQ